MEEEHERTLTSIERRLQFLGRAGSSKYGGSLLLAALKRAPEGQSPRWVNVLASVRPLPYVEKPSFSIAPLVEPYLDLFVARFPGSVVLFLQRVLEKGTLDVPQHAALPMLGQDTISFLDQNTSAQWHGPEFHSSEDAAFQFNEPWGTVSYFLETGGGAAQPTIPRENLERIGFYRLEQALWHHVLCPDGPTPETPSLHRSGIYVLIPCFDVRLGQVLILGQKIRVRVESQDREEAMALRLVLQSYGTDGRGRDSIVPPRIWEALPSLDVEHEYPTPIRSVRARLYWSADEEPSTAFVDEKNGVRAETVLYPQLAVREAFDPGLRSIEEALGTTKYPHDMEWAVVSLLAIAGFQVDWLGYKGRGRQTEGEVDFVAYLPSDKYAILGECTVRGADVGRKLSDLAGRAVKLSSLLEGWKLRKLLCSSIDHAAILPSDREGARELGVTILPKEGLARLARGVKSAVPAGSLWERLGSDMGDDSNYSRLSD